MTLSKEAFFLEDGQPMICYHLRWFWLPCCSSEYEVLRGVNVLFRGCSSSLQPQEAASHPVHPIVVCSEGFIPLWKEVLHLCPCRQSHFPLERALLLSSPLVARFFGGDGHGLQSSRNHFWLWAGSLLDVEAA